MKLYLQLGHGMMGYSEELVQKWSSGTVILSPRDLNSQQISTFSNTIHEKGGEILFDPQFYLPRANHPTLLEHSYWPAQYTTATFGHDQLIQMLKTLWESCNQAIGTASFILPGCYASEITEDWINYHENIIRLSNDLNVNVPRLATLCLSKNVLASEDQIHKLLESVESWEVDGFYVIPEHDGNYYVEDPVWLLNLMDLCAGLKLLSKKVVVGYANHQYLSLALCKVDAIASGTFINVRKFSLDKFNVNEEDTPSRRSTWYYSPQCLSEFQIKYLDMAQIGGNLNLIKADASFDSEYDSILFGSAKPTDTAFKESRAFRHYLQCLHKQTELAVRDSYKETLDSLFLQLTTSERLLNELHKKGVFGSYRDFGDILDVNRSAINLFNDMRNMILTHRWSSL